MKNLIVVLGSLIIAFAFNCFLVPFGILSSGISGIAILLGLISPFNTGLLNLVLNLPLIVLGYYKLGKTITINTMVCVVSLSAFLYVIPVVAITDNICCQRFSAEALVVWALVLSSNTQELLVVWILLRLSFPVQVLSVSAFFSRG